MSLSKLLRAIGLGLCNRKVQKIKLKSTKNASYSWNYTRRNSVVLQTWDIDSINVWLADRVGSIAYNFYMCPANSTWHESHILTPAQKLHYTWAMSNCFWNYMYWKYSFKLKNEEANYWSFSTNWHIANRKCHFFMCNHYSVSLLLSVNPFNTDLHNQCVSYTSTAFLNSFQVSDCFLP